MDSVLLYRFFGEQTVVSYDIIRKILSFGGIIMEKIGNQLVAPIASKISKGVAAFQKTEIKLLIFGLFGPGALGLFAVLFNRHIITIWVGEQYTVSFMFNATVALFLSAIMSVKWFLNISFSRGDFRVFAFSFTALFVLVTLGRYYACSKDSIMLYCTLQLVAAICLMGYHLFRVRKKFLNFTLKM